MSRSRYRVKCVSCGLEGEELENLGFTYFKGRVYCLNCYRSLLGTKPSIGGEEDVEEES